MNRRVCFSFEEKISQDILKKREREDDSDEEIEEISEQDSDSSDSQIDECGSQDTTASESGESLEEEDDVDSDNESEPSESESEEEEEQEGEKLDFKGMPLCNRVAVACQLFNK